MTILVGMDLQEAHLPLEVRRPLRGQPGPNGLLTPFGWCVVGRTFGAPGMSGNQILTVNHVSLSKDPLHEAFKRFCELESYGLVKQSVLKFTPEVQRMIQKVEESTVFVGDRYPGSRLALERRRPDSSEQPRGCLPTAHATRTTIPA